MTSFLKLLAATVVATSISFAATDAAQAATPTFAHFAAAYGTRVSGSTVTSGPTWLAVLPTCTTRRGDHRENAGSGIDITGEITTGAIDNNVSTFSSGGVNSTLATSDVQSVDLLGGAISASTLHAASQVNQGSPSTFENRSSVGSLEVLGKAFVAPAPNTRINVPGVGYVLLNQTLRTVTSTYVDQTVNLIHVFVTDPANTFGLAVGTQIIVGHADAGISIPLAGGVIHGIAYGSDAAVGTTVTSSRSAPATILCLGGSDANQVASTDVPNLFTTDSVLDTGTSSLTSSATSGTTESTVQGLNLLNGLVTATEIKARAHGSFDGMTHTFGSSVTVTDLVVAGKAVVNPSVNTRITINGLGVLYVNRVVRQTKLIVVRGLELVVTDSGNSFGLAEGMHVRIANATLSFSD